MADIVIVLENGEHIGVERMNCWRLAAVVAGSEPTAHCKVSYSVDSMAVPNRLSSRCHAQMESLGINRGSQHVDMVEHYALLWIRGMSGHLARFSKSSEPDTISPQSSIRVESEGDHAEGDLRDTQDQQHHQDLRGFTA